MDRPVWTDQCDDCGRRYPSAAKLRKHTTRMHGERVHCQFQGCNWNCSSQDVYRLRKHELDSHSRRRFIPMVTPRPHQSMPSVVNIPSLHSTTSTPLKTPPPTPNWKLNESTRHALMELDQEMSDFADMFNFREPATPSPMRRLRDEDSPEVEHPVPSDLASIPSDQLFSKYLTSESDTAEGGYSPSDPPFIAGREVTTSVTELESPVTRETPPETPEIVTVTRLPPTEEVYDLSVHSISDGVINNATMGIEPESLATKETPTVEPNPVAPVPETEELSSPQQQEPLDLRVNQH